MRKLPSKWEDALADWIKGTPFSETLNWRTARDAQRTQVFVQEGIVFRLVWAAEAVRVQAIATDHVRASELGDGPAFALTYGTPSIPAALLCQMGFSSRVGAVWVVRKLAASFSGMNGAHTWLRQHDALVSTRDFWESDDLYPFGDTPPHPRAQNIPDPGITRPTLLPWPGMGLGPQRTARYASLPGMTGQPQSAHQICRPWVLRSLHSIRMAQHSMEV